MMTSVMVNGSLQNGTGLFGQRRNHLKSMWDILFGDQPKEWIGFKPTLGEYVYPCYSCRHMFSSLTSLQDHINRRIMVLKFHCYSCPDEELIFYNRCTLLLHTRNHFPLDEGQINLYEVNTFTLPLHLAGFLPIPEIPRLYEKEDDSSCGDVYVNAQFYSPSIGDRGKQIILLKPTDFLYKEANQTLTIKQICKKIPKCQFITMEEKTKLKELAATENTRDNIKVELFDYIDNLTLPVISKVESLYDTFNFPHCLDCNSVQDGTMAEHYLGNNQPSDPRLTCQDCKFIAPSKCSFNAHVRIHKKLAPFVCPDCGKNFQNFDLLKEHLNEVCFHLSKNVKIRCSFRKCNKLFACQSNFALHVKYHFQVTHTCNVCKITISDSHAVDSHTAFHNGNCFYYKEFYCKICEDKRAIKEADFDAHLSLHTDTVYVYMCYHCRRYFRSTATFASHSVRCVSRALVERPESFCLDCKKKNYCPSRKLMGYCFKNTKAPIKKIKITKKYFCILCSEQIQLEEKRTHMKKCLYARPVVLLHPIDNKRNDSFSSDNSFRSEGKRSSKSSDSLRSEDSGKKKRKRPLNLRPRREKDVVEPDLTADKPVEFDGTYYCKLCDYKNSVREDFHAHIRNHRDVSTSYQCMECGECFVVKPSLNKHLMHFHNITDYQTYLIKNDCYDVEAVQELKNFMRLAPGETKETSKENQCSVCLEDFEDVATLKTHYRSHGMAFLLKNTK